jgi:hypothetical protein
LPHGATGVPPLPTDVALPPAQALAEAQRLLDEGYLFQAHEVLEAAWKAAPAAERELWQGVTQLVVGATHLARGNPRGALALLARGGDRLAPYAADRPHGIDVPGLLTWTRRQTAEIHATADPDIACVAPSPRGPGTPPLPVEIPRLTRPDRADHDPL